MTVFNRIGNLSSNWSYAILNQPQIKPTQPTNLNIIDTYSTGFTIGFREPVEFNGYLSHYSLRIQPFTIEKDSFYLIFSAEKKCKSSSKSTQLNVTVSGLESFRSYRLILTAVNDLGLESNPSDVVIANTLESGPNGLKPLKTVAYSNRVVFKFTDPEHSNGEIKRINLYEIKPNLKPPIKRVYFDYELDLIYSGLNREFIYTGLNSFTKYSFLYEICSMVACTRELTPVELMTLQSPPEFQPEPVVSRLMPFLSCFHLDWTFPMSPNGIILFFEIYRSAKSMRGSDQSEEIRLKTVYIQEKGN